LYQKLLEKESFRDYLLRIEKDLAQERKKKGCSCGGKLHNAHYERKPRGPWELKGKDSYRLSLCCGQQGCRLRCLPPSILFMGRRVYLGVIVVLVTALRQGATPLSQAKLKAWVGADLRTIRRWRKWWQKEFPESPFWRGIQGLFSGEIAGRDLPLVLLEKFKGSSAEERLVQLLRVLAPLGGHAL
jgi:hypothetical protein